MNPYHHLRGRPVRVECSTGTINGTLHSVTNTSLWLLVAGDDRFVPIVDVLGCEVQ
jgi:hypothetical protein